MKARTVTMLRLLTVQSAWTYERMLGIGVAHASAPLLAELRAQRSPEESAAMVARSAEFFNSHPYLAGVAVGALARAESDAVPGTAVLRLRSALAGPLGALGDQLVWAGEVPILIGLGLLGATRWGGLAVLLVVILHNIFRVWLIGWGLSLGLREGLQVGAALQRSWLPRTAVEAQRLAALAIGMAVPVSADWLLSSELLTPLLATAGLALLGVILGQVANPRWRLSGLKFGLLLMLLTLLLVGEL